MIESVLVSAAIFGYLVVGVYVAGIMVSELVAGGDSVE